jgi:hypothetical protein
MKKLQEIKEKAALEAKAAAGDEETDDDSEATEDSSESEDDYGPSPAAGIWAGSQKLQHASEQVQVAEGQGDAETDDD